MSLSEEEVNHVLERFDQTEPAIQRGIVAQIMFDLHLANLTITELLAACQDALEEITVLVPGKAADPILLRLEAAIAKAKGATP